MTNVNNINMVEVNLSGSSVLCITENIIKVYQFHDNL